MLIIALWLHSYYRPSSSVRLFVLIFLFVFACCLCEHSWSSSRRDSAKMWTMCQLKNLIGAKFLKLCSLICSFQFDLDKSFSINLQQVSVVAVLHVYLMTTGNAVCAENWHIQKETQILMQFTVSIPIFLRIVGEVTAFLHLSIISGAITYISVT